MNFKDILDNIKDKWNSFMSNLFPNNNKVDNSYYSEETVDPKTKDTHQTYWNEGEKKSSFWQDGSKFIQGSHNGHANNKQLKKDDFNEMRKKIFSKLIKSCIAIAIVLLALICALSIYKLGYNMLNENDISTIGGYSDFLVTEDLMQPIINKYDLVIVKFEDNYQYDDIVLYEYATSSHKLGKVIDADKYYYTVLDNATGSEGFDTPRETVVGKVIIRLKNFYNIYNTVTSPLFVVFLIGIIALYFYLNLKGKAEDD